MEKFYGFFVDHSAEYVANLQKVGIRWDKADFEKNEKGYKLRTKHAAENMTTYKDLKQLFKNTQQEHATRESYSANIPGSLQVRWPVSLLLCDMKKFLSENKPTKKDIPQNTPVEKSIEKSTTSKKSKNPLKPIFTHAFCAILGIAIYEYILRSRAVPIKTI